MKEKFISGLFFGLGFLLSFFIYTKLSFSFPLNIQSVVTNKNEVFTISGEGKIVVIPDIAYVSLGIEANGATVSQTQRKINEVNNQLIEALKNLEIDKKDIQTENYNLNPQYDWQSNFRRIIGYNAVTTLRVKVKPLEKINQVIDEATKAGVNNIYGVDFEVDEKEKYLSKVRQQAVDEAKKKAKEVARISGFRLGKIVNYSETVSSPAEHPIYALGMVKTEQEKETNVQPGSQEIKITVNLGYEIN